MLFEELNIPHKVGQQQFGHVDRHPLLYQNPLHNHVLYIGRQAVRGHQPTAYAQAISQVIQGVIGFRTGL